MSPATEEFREDAKTTKLIRYYLDRCALGGTISQ